MDTESLRAALAKIEKLLDIQNEFSGQTDRGAALIGAALVESELTRLIVSRLVNSTGASRRLFKRGGAIESFGPQTTLAYAVGFISKDVYCDLNLIREIRNKFAHEVWYVEDKQDPEDARILVTFAYPKIKAWALSLSCPRAIGLDAQHDKRADERKRLFPQFQDESKPELQEEPRARFEFTCNWLRTLLIRGQRTNDGSPLQYHQSPPISNHSEAAI